MKLTYTCTILSYILQAVLGYWDYATTTPAIDWRWDEFTLRTSRFRWQRSESSMLRLFVWWWDWKEIVFRRRLFTVAGVTYGMINLSTASILNRRTLISSYNYLDPYMNDVRNLRIWALGRKGYFNTPYRYRVWRVTRLVPRSLHPEHQHGPLGEHSPKDDIVVIHTLDQIYLFSSGASSKWHYAYKAFLLKTNRLTTLIYFAGCGFEYLKHIKENYKIFYHRTDRNNLRDCSKFIPKWWGKFICFVNTILLPCVQNGGPLYDYRNLAGVGCFEMRYNDEAYFVFTDIRYYIQHIYNYARVEPGEYYEYAYPQWAVRSYLLFDGYGNNPIILSSNKRYDLYPLG